MTFEEFLQKAGISQEQFNGMSAMEKYSIQKGFFASLWHAAEQPKEEKKEPHFEPAQGVHLTKEDLARIEARNEEYRTDIFREAEEASMAFAQKSKYVPQNVFNEELEYAKSIYGNDDPDKENRDVCEYLKGVFNEINLTTVMEMPSMEKFDHYFPNNNAEAEKVNNRDAEVNAGDYLAEIFRLNDRMKRNSRGTRPIKDMCKKIDRLRKAVEDGTVDPAQMKAGELDDLLTSMAKSAEEYQNDKKGLKSLSSTQKERLKCINQVYTLKKMLNRTPPMRTCNSVEGLGMMLATKITCNAAIKEGKIKDLADANTIVAQSETLYKSDDFQKLVNTNKALGTFTEDFRNEWLKVKGSKIMSKYAAAIQRQREQAVAHKEPVKANVQVKKDSEPQIIK